MFYILTPDKLAIPCEDVLQWAMWCEDDSRRRVALDEIDGHRVSTVFLGLNQRYGRGDPLLFETMVFLADGTYGNMARYSTWAEAAAGHERIASMLRREHADAGMVGLELLQKLRSCTNTPPE